MSDRSKFVCFSLAAALLVVASLPIAMAAESPASQTGGERYIVMVPHTKEDCLKALDAFNAESKKMLDQMDWGCMSGDHTGYVILQAANEEAARNMLPASERSKAKVIKLNKFTSDQIRQFHETM